MPCAAAELRRRLEWYRTRLETEAGDAEGEDAALVSRPAAGEPMPAI
jgi:hypothetical protein